MTSTPAVTVLPLPCFPSGRIHEYHAHGAALVDGYAPFCKHVFVPNFVGAKLGALPVSAAAGIYRVLTAPIHSWAWVLQDVLCVSLRGKPAILANATARTCHMDGSSPPLPRKHMC